jgi:hypothetical protein
VRFADVLERLEREGVRYVVMGGFALVLHGLERPTADLDLAVEPAAAEAARTLLVLAAAGFVPTIPLSLSEVTVLRTIDPEGREIDVFARPYVPFAELWARSELIPSGTTMVRVASVADLIRAKRARGLPEDLRDADQLVRRLADGASGPR